MKNEQYTCDFMHDLCNDCMAEFVRWWKDGKVT